MVAEISTTDPYTLVARHLQDGEATRAELRASTDLEYAQIEAALERFEIMETVAKRTDGKGIEHYRWQGEDYAPEPTRAVARAPQPVVNVEPDATFKGGVADDLEAGPSRAARPIGWSLSGKVQEFVEAVADGAEISSSLIYDWMLMRFPNACETYEVRELRNRISMALNNLAGTLISRAGVAQDNKTVLYRKGLIETKVSARREASSPDTAKNITKTITEKPPCGCGRAGNHIGRCAFRRAKTGGDFPAKKPPTNGQKSVRKETAIARSRPLDEIAPKERIALHSSQVTQNDSATYALPAFISELRAEREELDLLIALLEKRMMRGGAQA